MKEDFNRITLEGEETTIGLHRKRRGTSVETHWKRRTTTIGQLWKERELLQNYPERGRDYYRTTLEGEGTTIGPLWKGTTQEKEDTMRDLLRIGRGLL